jgi:hypothetical protein
MATKRSKKEGRTLKPASFPTWCRATILFQAVAISALQKAEFSQGPITLNKYGVHVKRQNFASQDKFLEFVK